MPFRRSGKCNCPVPYISYHPVIYLMFFLKFGHIQSDEALKYTAGELRTSWVCREHKNQARYTWEFHDCFASCRFYFWAFNVFSIQFSTRKKLEDLWKLCDHPLVIILFFFTHFNTISVLYEFRIFFQCSWLAKALKWLWKLLNNCWHISTYIYNTVAFYKYSWAHFDIISA